MNTVPINPQIIKDEAGRSLGVFLTTTEFQQLLDELEELEDIKAYDEAKGRENDDSIPFRQAIDEIRKGIVK
ncbi:MAG TPA: hypothetical protein VN726_05820 [Hanamia sp.]|nr:hypothetical protein [Hanamia sp.]